MHRPLPDQIETKRLRLREPVLTDARSIFDAYAQDPEVCRFMTWTPHDSEATVRDFIQTCIDDWLSGHRMAYIITKRSGNDPMGMLDARILANRVDIGYVLARPTWGNGFMPEAIRGLVDAALGSSDIYRVQAVCDVENVASQRALEKAGFLREGRLERYLVHPNRSAAPRPCFMYATYR